MRKYWAKPRAGEATGYDGDARGEREVVIRIGEERDAPVIRLVELASNSAGRPVSSAPKYVFDGSCERDRASIWSTRSP